MKVSDEYIVSLLKLLNKQSVVQFGGESLSKLSLAIEELYEWHQNFREALEHLKDADGGVVLDMLEPEEPVTEIFIFYKKDFPDNKAFSEAVAEKLNQGFVIVELGNDYRGGDYIQLERFMRHPYTCVADGEDVVKPCWECTLEKEGCPYK